MPRRSGLRPLGVVGGCVLLAAGIVWAGGSAGAELGGLSVFAWCALAAFALNWIAFVPAYLLRTERFYDLVGSFTYLVVVSVAVVAGPRRPTSVLLAVLVVCWAARLGTFLVQRIRRDGTDGRFDTIKGDPARFLMTWTLQALWVLVTVGCALAAMTSTRDPGAPWLQVLGVLVWLAGFAVEVAADQQKRRFRSDPAHRDDYIRTGLWAWSRHPNYVGEIVLWVGVALVALPVLAGWQFVTLISPVFVAVLLTKVSGVPLLEARGRRRWGDDPAYLQYLADTPVLVPRPPRRR